MKLPKKTIAALTVALAAFSGTAGAETLATYILTHGDTLHIAVPGYTDAGYLVRPDGKLSLPLLGELSVEGKTISEFTNELTALLSEYLRDPRVTINITGLGGTRVFVLGEVRNPGMFTLSRSHRLLDAVGAAGGFTQYAAKKNVFLIREGREDKLEKLNFNNFLREGDQSQNVELHEGDCLYFTSNNKVDFTKDIMPWLTGYYYVDRIVRD